MLQNGLTLWYQVTLAVLEYWLLNKDDSSDIWNQQPSDVMHVSCGHKYTIATAATTTDGFCLLYLGWVKAKLVVVAESQ